MLVVPLRYINCKLDLMPSHILLLLDVLFLNSIHIITFYIVQPEDLIRSARKRDDDPAETGCWFKKSSGQHHFGPVILRIAFGFIFIYLLTFGIKSYEENFDSMVRLIICLHKTTREINSVWIDWK